MEEPLLELLLVVEDPELSASRLDALTREMTMGLNRERGLEARLPEGESQPGARGGPVEIGTIILALLAAHGPVVTLLEGVKAYFLRKESLVIDVKRKDGTTFKLKAENVSEAQIERTTSQLVEFLKG